MSWIRPTGACIQQGRACRRRLLLLCPGTRCTTSIFFMCSTIIYPVFSSIWAVGVYLKCCTAPFALGRKQALGFTPSLSFCPASRTLMAKRIIIRAQGLLHMPMWDLISLLFLAPAICKLHYSAVERKFPFPSSPMHAMQLEKRKPKHSSPLTNTQMFTLCASWLLDPFPVVYLDNLRRLLVLADVRFACLIYEWIILLMSDAATWSLYLDSISLSLRVGVSAAQCVESAVNSCGAVRQQQFSSCLLLLVVRPSLPARQSLNFESLKPNKI